VTAALSPTDEQLLAAVGRREPGALEVLYDRHHGLALGLARRILRDTEAAEDAVQEVFLAVWRQAERYRPERGAVKTWLLAMVHHRAIDRLRRRATAGPAAELSEEMEDRHSAPIWQQVLQQIQGEQIGAALASLPPEQRETIELAYFGGKSQSEIAALLGVPLGTVKGRTRLALEKLRGLLLGLREELT
jgi:RNA polymerase sigma-70 factor, ECF subfamily